jgi:hypothetical protein
MPGIAIGECEKRTRKLIQLYEDKTPEDQLRTCTMESLEFLWDESNVLYDLVKASPKEQGRSAREYFDGVKLGELAHQIALKLREHDLRNLEEIALRIRLKALLQVQGHCHHIIGPAMLEHSELLCDLGRVDEASHNYDCIIGDFSWLLDEYRNSHADVTEEDQVALKALWLALNKRLGIGQMLDENFARMTAKIEETEQILASLG